MSGEDLAALVNAVPDPEVTLDIIERLNALPDAGITVEGVWGVDDNDCEHARHRDGDPECPECGAEMSGDG